MSSPAASTTPMLVASINKPGGGGGSAGRPLEAFTLYREALRRNAGRSDEQAAATLTTSASLELRNRPAVHPRSAHLEQALAIYRSALPAESSDVRQVAITWPRCTGAVGDHGTGESILSRRPGKRDWRPRRRADSAACCRIFMRAAGRRRPAALSLWAIPVDGGRSRHRSIVAPRLRVPAFSVDPSDHREASPRPTRRRAGRPNPLLVRGSAACTAHPRPAGEGAPLSRRYLRFPLASSISDTNGGQRAPLSALPMYSQCRHDDSRPVPRCILSNK